MNYGHRFDIEEIATAFARYCEDYKWLNGLVVTDGRVVGLTGEVEISETIGNKFVTMTNAFDAGAELLQEARAGEAEALKRAANRA